MAVIDEPAGLSENQVAALLSSMLGAIRNEVEQLPEPARRWHPAAGEWCAKEVIGHLIEAEERGFAGRIRTILALDEPELEAWDQAAAERERRDCDRPMAALLEEFDELRRNSVEFVQGLRPVDLARGGRHPRVGLLRVQDLLNEWIHHDRNHFRQLLANVQAYVWPRMGNSQRFYSD